jgi:hypothetical protein
MVVVCAGHLDARTRVDISRYCEAEPFQRWGSRGRGFKSRRPDQENRRSFLKEWGRSRGSLPLFGSSQGVRARWAEASGSRLGVEFGWSLDAGAAECGRVWAAKKRRVLGAPGCAVAGGAVHSSVPVSRRVGGSGEDCRSFLRPPGGGGHDGVRGAVAGGVNQRGRPRLGWGS